MRRRSRSCTAQLCASRSPICPSCTRRRTTWRFFTDRFLPANQVWVAEADGALVGYVGFDTDWIHHLYVHPTAQGQGVGRKLLAKALADGQPKRLWTFQKNAAARRFYEARGFKLLELADGSGNEEKEPDALYEWLA